MLSVAYGSQKQLSKTLALCSSVQEDAEGRCATATTLSDMQRQLTALQPSSPLQPPANCEAMERALERSDAALSEAREDHGMDKERVRELELRMDGLQAELAAAAAANEKLSSDLMSKARDEKLQTGRPEAQGEGLRKRRATSGRRYDPSVSRPSAEQPPDHQVNQARRLRELQASLVEARAATLSSDAQAKLLTEALAAARKREALEERERRAERDGWRQRLAEEHRFAEQLHEDLKRSEGRQGGAGYASVEHRALELEEKVREQRETIRQLITKLNKAVPKEAEGRKGRAHGTHGTQRGARTNHGTHGGTPRGKQQSDWFGGPRSELGSGWFGAGNELGSTLRWLGLSGTGASGGQGCRHVRYGHGGWW